MYNERRQAEKNKFEYRSDLVSQLGSYVLSKFYGNSSSRELQKKAQGLINPALKQLGDLVEKIEEDIELQCDGHESKHNMFKLRGDNISYVNGSRVINKESIQNDARHKLYSIVSRAVSDLHSLYPQNDVLEFSEGYSAVVSKLAMQYC